MEQRSTLELASSTPVDPARNVIDDAVEYKSQFPRSSSFPSQSYMSSEDSKERNRYVESISPTQK